MKRITPERLEPYRRAVSDRICGVCNDRDVHGDCARDPRDPCPLQQRLTLLVESVLSVGRSPRLEDYLGAIRRITCAHCRMDSAGECIVRDLVECPADSYVLPLIQVIEEVAVEQGDAPAEPPAPETRAAT